MLQEQYEKLRQAASEHAYTSIAVNEDGRPVYSGSVPWVQTANAFNMKTPKIALAADDLEDPDILELLRQCRLNGCYLYAPIRNYGILSGFTDLRDLCITNGTHVKDLSFVSTLRELYMFCLSDADIPDLEPLVSAMSRSSGPGKCLAFRRCHVEDTSALRNCSFRISELLIWPCPDDDISNWRTVVPPTVFRYFLK